MEEIQWKARIVFVVGGKPSVVGLRGLRMRMNDRD
jgi:hypothetical protein